MSNDDDAFVIIDDDVDEQLFINRKKDLAKNKKLMELERPDED